MTELFRIVLNMSVTGSIAVAGVMLLRLPLKKAPHWIRYALWLVVFFRLLVPVSFSSPVSILGGVGAPNPVEGVMVYLPEYSSDTAQELITQSSGLTNFASIDQSPMDSADSLAPTPQASTDPMQIWLAISTAVWLSGIVWMLGSSAVLYVRLYRRIRDAVFVEPSVFETDAITSPFVMGFFRPRIILPLHMLKRERELVLRHERAHIYRFDHVVKPIGFLLLAVHWFNPLIWIAFKLFCVDMETSCDERAIRTLDQIEIVNYGEVLLRLGTRKPSFAGGPLAFGENCTKGRIMNVLNYKRPAFWVIATDLLIAVAAGIVLLANPLVQPKQALVPTMKEMNLVDIKPSTFDRQSYTVLESNQINGKFVMQGFGGEASKLVTYGIELKVLGDKVVSADTIADFVNQLANGNAYIRAYLKKNAEGCYDKKTAISKVDYEIYNDDQYSYDIDTYPLQVRVGKMYWHCAQYDVLMILHPESLHWQHFGYAEYLGSVLNPYDVMLSRLNQLGVTLTMGKYVQAYYDQGGTEKKITNEDYRLLVDAAAYYSLVNGMNWGSAYDSAPITSIDGFIGTAEQGDDMSVMMASSFCAYLAEHYGFDRLTSYCAGQRDFSGAFGISFDRARVKWEKTILQEFA